MDIGQATKIKTDYNEKNQGFYIKPTEDEKFEYISFHEGQMFPWKVKAGEQSRLRLSCHLLEDYHIYAPESQGPSTATKFQLDKNDFFSIVKVTGIFPNKKTSGEGDTYYEGTGVFEIQIQVEPNAKQGIHEIPGNMTFQLCNEMGCQPITDARFGFTLNVEGVSSEFNAGKQGWKLNGADELDYIRFEDGKFDPWSLKSGAKTVLKLPYALVHNEAETEIFHIYDPVKGGDGKTIFSIEGGDFKIIESKITGAKAHKDDDGIVSYQDPGVFEVTVEVSNNARPGLQVLKGSVLFQVCSDMDCKPQETLPFSITLNIEGDPSQKPVDGKKEIPASGNGDSEEKASIRDASLWSLIATSIIAGLLALLTPCVFPMIPVTVSFFTKQSAKGDRNLVLMALVYVFGIISSFTLVGLLLALLIGKEDAANSLASSVWLNLLLSIVFLLFALSLLGMFELRLPSGMVNLFQSRSRSGGYSAVVFMALTFTMVSFTCTAPFVGSLLGVFLSGAWWRPIIGMVAFSGTLAFPFFFFALFPNFLKSLPGSGGWMESVKVVMGFVELMFMFKFLGAVDQIWGLQIFTWTSVLGIWAVICVFTGMYLLGKISVGHEAPPAHLSVPRMLLSMSFISFAVYLGQGLITKDIHPWIYGWLPPLESTSSHAGPQEKGQTKYSNLPDALAAAKAEGKPIFIDFTGVT